MLDETAVDAACEEWGRCSDTLFTRRDKVRCVIETYLEHANKHSDSGQWKHSELLKQDVFVPDKLPSQNSSPDWFDQHGSKRCGHCSNEIQSKT